MTACAQRQRKSGECWETIIHGVLWINVDDTPWLWITHVLRPQPLKRPCGNRKYASLLNYDNNDVHIERTMR